MTFNASTLLQMKTVILSWWSNGCVTLGVVTDDFDGEMEESRMKGGRLAIIL